MRQVGKRQGLDIGKKRRRIDHLPHFFVFGGSGQKMILHGDKFKEGEVVPVIGPLSENGRGEIGRGAADADAIPIGRVVQRAVLAQQVGDCGQRGGLFRMGIPRNFCEIQWRSVRIVPGVRIGFGGQKRFDDFGRDFVHCAVQGRSALAVFGVRIRSRGQKQIDQICIASLRGHMERSFSAVIFDIGQVHVRLVRQQHFNHGLEAPLCGRSAERFRQKRSARSHPLPGSEAVPPWSFGRFGRLD